MSGEEAARIANQGPQPCTHHQSTGVPCPLFRMTSGAEYSGVPQRVKVRQSALITLAKPKSAGSNRTGVGAWGT